MKLCVGPKPPGMRRRSNNESMEKSRKIAEQTMADTEKKGCRKDGRRKKAMEELPKTEGGGTVRWSESCQPTAPGGDIGPDVQPGGHGTDGGQPGADSGRIARQVADCATMGVEDMMNQLLVGIWESSLRLWRLWPWKKMRDDEEEEPELTLALEQELYRVLEGKAGLAGHTAGARNRFPYAKE